MEYVLLTTGFLIIVYVLSTAYALVFLTSQVVVKQASFVLISKLEEYASEVSLDIVETDYMYNNMLGCFYYKILPTSKEIVPGTMFIGLKKSLSDEKKAVILAHECGHHFNVIHYRDDSEEKAWEWADALFKTCPLWVQYALIPTRRKFSTPYFSKSFNPVTVLLSYKEDDFYQYTRGGVKC